MPRRYNKKRYRKKYTKKAKGANDKTVTVWSDHNLMEKANRALNIANKVYRFVNTEVKYFDTITTSNVPSTGTINGLTIVPQGDTAQTRDGQSIKPLNLVIRSYLNKNTGSTVTDLVRVIIFRGKQENGVGYSPTRS